MVAKLDGGILVLADLVGFPCRLWIVVRNVLRSYGPEIDGSRFC
jgi:hypothetical protein